jgi:beta-1,4-mannosyl-glycoprotein beta-1,4-N-acetylglucosaminyltransferase
MIYDAFQFFNEPDVLEIRLHELDSVVDWFIIAEATHTHSGKPKPLYLSRYSDRLKPFRHKIRHVVADISRITESGQWAIQDAQRNVITEGLRDAKPDDWLILSDVDEIPRATALRECRADITTLQMRFYYWKFNLQHKFWSKARVLRVGAMKRAPAMYREIETNKIMAGGGFLFDAGWHFSKCMDVAGIREFMAASAHTDLAEWNIEASRNAGVIDWLGHNIQFSRVPVDDSYPAWLRQNQERFKELFA